MQKTKKQNRKIKSKREQFFQLQQIKEEKKKERANLLSTTMKV